MRRRVGPVLSARPCWPQNSMAPAFGRGVALGQGTRRLLNELLLRTPSNEACDDDVRKTLADAASGRSVDASHFRHRLAQVLAPLSCIDLRCRLVEDDGAILLCEALATSTKLVELNLSCNRLGDRGLSRLPQLLSRSPSLRRLVLDGNGIKDAGVQHVADGLLACNPTVESSEYPASPQHAKTGVVGAHGVRPDSCGGDGGGNGGGATAAAASTTSGESAAACSAAPLNSLCLRGNLLGDDGAAVLAAGLACGAPSLRHLNLRGNDIGSSGVGSIAKALSSHCNLDSINLDYNQVGPLGAEHLAAALGVERFGSFGGSNSSGAPGGECGQVHAGGHVVRPAMGKAPRATPGQGGGCALRALSLAACAVLDQGAAALAEAVACNTRLTRLELCQNGISDSGACQLAVALAQKNVLAHLGLGNNRVRDAGATALGEALVVPAVSLTSLDLSDNAISDDGIEELACALMSNVSLQSLGLNNTWVLDEGVTSLTKSALCSNSALLEVSVNGIEADDDLVRQLQQALADNNARRQRLDFFFGLMLMLRLLAGPASPYPSLRHGRVELREPNGALALLGRLLQRDAGLAHAFLQQIAEYRL